MLPMAVVGLLAWRRSAVALSAIAAIAIIWLAANITMFANGIWLSAAVPITAAVPPAIVYGATQLWLDRRRAHRFARQNELLRRFQSPALRDWLARNPNFLAEPVRQEAAIVFIDLSGFTSFSEVTSAQSMYELLDDFYRLVEQDVEAHKGVITNFMGDGAMIVFGLPEPTPDDPANALRCSVALAAHSRAWLTTQPVTVAKRIGIKLGAHCGSIVASRLGGGSQQQITATGDSVNVASRLMEVAAENRADVALSADLYRAAGNEGLPFVRTTARSDPIPHQGPIEPDIGLALAGRRTPAGADTDQSEPVELNQEELRFALDPKRTAAIQDRSVETAKLAPARRCRQADRPTGRRAALARPQSQRCIDPSTSCAPTLCPYRPRRVITLRSVIGPPTSSALVMASAGKL